MICEKSAKQFCCEDISLIENYQEAINDSERWECHHKLGVNKSRQELKENDLYFNRPSSELIFLRHVVHRKMHTVWNKGKTDVYSDETKLRISNSLKDQTAWNKGKSGFTWNPTKRKYKWLTPSGEIKIMHRQPVLRFHPDWKEIGEA